jgi:hypothetical protein
VIKVVEMAKGDWVEESGWAGSFSEVMKLAEKVTGRRFEVNYTTREDLEEMAMNEVSNFVRFENQAMLFLAIGKEVPEDLTLNGAWKPTSVPEFLRSGGERHIRCFSE